MLEYYDTEGPSAKLTSKLLHLLANIFECWNPSLLLHVLLSNESICLILFLKNYYYYFITLNR